MAATWQHKIEDEPYARPETRSGTSRRRTYTPGFRISGLSAAENDVDPGVDQRDVVVVEMAAALGEDPAVDRNDPGDVRDRILPGGPGRTRPHAPPLRSITNRYSVICSTLVIARPGTRPATPESRARRRPAAPTR